MEMLNISRIGRFVPRRALLLAFALALPLASCKTSSRTTEILVSRPDAPELGPVVIPPAPDSASTETEVTPTEQSALPSRTAGVELFLGTGFSTGFAHQGVLKAFHQWKMKIVGIHATEVGALVAVSYAESMNPNRMDWTLSQFTDAILGKKTSGLVFSQGDSIDVRVERKLKEVFDQKTLNSLKIPVILPVPAPNPLSLWEQIRVALTHPKYLSPYQGYSATNYDRFRDDFSNRTTHSLILIETVSNGTSTIERDDSRRLLKLKIALPQFEDQDFKRKTQAAYFGRQAVDKWKAEITAFLGAEDFNR